MYLLQRVTDHIPANGAKLNKASTAMNLNYDNKLLTCKGNTGILVQL